MLPASHAPPPPPPPPPSAPPLFGPTKLSCFPALGGWGGTRGGGGRWVVGGGGGGEGHGKQGAWGGIRASISIFFVSIFYPWYYVSFLFIHFLYYFYHYHNNIIPCTGLVSYLTKYVQKVMLLALLKPHCLVLFVKRDSPMSSVM